MSAANVSWPSYMAVVSTPQSLAEVINALVSAYVQHAGGGDAVSMDSLAFGRFCAQQATVGGKPFSFARLMTALEDRAGYWPDVDEDGVFEAFALIGRASVLDKGQGVYKGACAAVGACRNFEMAALSERLDKSMSRLQRISGAGGLEPEDGLAVTEMIAVGYTYAGFLTDALHGRLAQAVRVEELLLDVIDFVELAEETLASISDSLQVA